MSEPRWLDADSAARYLSIDLISFKRQVRANRIPPPSRHLGERTPRWDRDALDSAMNEASAVDKTQEAVDALVQKIKTGSLRTDRKARTA